MVLFLCAGLWHGTWCSNLCVHGPRVSWMRCGMFLAPTKTKGSFTAFSSISTGKGWQKQTTASEFPAVQQATNDRQKRLVTAWCCFSVLGCDMERGAQISVYMGRGCHEWGVAFFSLQQKPKEVSRRSVQFPLKKADKSKPLHPNFRLFSKQPTTDKKGW